MQALINGHRTDVINVTDRGLHYGDGLFETMAVISGHIRRLDLHLTRLETGCARLGIRAPSRELLTRELGELAAEVAPETSVVLKLIVTRGAAARGYQVPDDANSTRIITVNDWPTYPDHWHDTGVTARWCTTTLADQPLLAGIKHLNRLENVLARREWSDPDIAEGLLCDIHGRLISGTMTNIFLVHDEGISTPRLDRCGVAGTTRATVLRRAHSLGFRTEEKDLTPHDVSTADEIFLTNAVIGIWPVRQLAGRRISIGPVTRKLQEFV